MAQQLKIDIVAKDRSQQAFNKMQGSLAKVKASVFNLRNAFIGLGAGLVLRGIINAGMQIENLGVQLEALTGSAAKGKLMLKQVLDYAKNTPFELKNVQQGVTALATVSEKAEEMGISFEELLKITGNTAVQLGGDFALASQQIQRSFSAGIGSADLFRDKAVTAMAGFSAGVKTSVDESIKGLAKAFGTGGKFGELTNKLAQTLSGTVSNLKDAFFTIQTEIAAGFFDELKSQLGDLKQFTETNDEAIRRLSKNIGENLAKGLTTAANAVKLLADNFRDLQSVLGIVLIALGGVLKIIVGAALIIDDINKRFDKFKKIATDVKSPFDEIRKSSEAIVESQENITKATKKTKSLMEEVTEQIKKGNDAYKIQDEIVKMIKGGVGSISKSIAESIVLGKELTASFKALAQQILVNIISKTIERIILLKIEKALLGDIVDEEAKKNNEISKQNTNLKKQIMLNALTGGGGNIMSMFGGGKASGGAVSKGQPVLVGENGAEMFVPNSSGQITQSARGTGGGSTTVNFNINTVDASGFDELLTQSRGTITQLINQAVNERGAKSII
tara:strand:+ start:523 stop:2208 length:1686 start_codon:yes stop_codon:yes gene_type:complete